MIWVLTSFLSWKGWGGGGFCIDFVLRQGEVCVHTKTGPSGRSFSQFWEHQGIRNISTPPGWYLSRDYSIQLKLRICSKRERRSFRSLGIDHFSISHCFHTCIVLTFHFPVLSHSTIRDLTLQLRFSYIVHCYLQLSGFGSPVEVGDIWFKRKNKRTKASSELHTSTIRVQFISQVIDPVLWRRTKVSVQRHTDWSLFGKLADCMLYQKLMQNLYHQSQMSSYVKF